MTSENGSARDDLLYFVSCALNGVPADRERAEKTDLDALYDAAKRHMLTALVAHSLERAGVSDDAFTQAKSKAVRKAVLLEAERTEIQRQLDAAGIWYMPLKGTVIRDLYPFLGAREMADCDILFDAARAEDVCAIMTGRGFEVKAYGKGGAHDSYTKPPVYNFEMHRMLFSELADGPAPAYYKDVKSRLLPDGDGSLGFRFTDEDLYVYLIGHAHKHFSNNGTGLRSLADVYVFERAKGDALDRAYVRAELEKLELSDFEERFRGLALRLFGGRELSGEDQTMLDYILGSGTYGRVSNGVNNRISDLGGGTGGRVRYIWERIFLPMETVRAAFPLFAKVPILLPFLPFYRLFRGLATGRRRLHTEWKTLFSRKKSKEERQ